MYWTLDRHGCPINDRKHIYAQAFAIYGLAEFYRATGEPHSLQLAQNLFDLIERHSFDPVYGGNIEGCSRAWGPLADMRLSDKEAELPQVDEHAAAPDGSVHQSAARVAG